MESFSQLRARITNPLDWSSAGKCWLLLLMTAVLHSEYLLWGIYLTDLGANPYVDTAYASAQMPWLELVCATSWLLVALLPGLHRRTGDSVLYEYFALLFYGLTLCYVSHFTGTLSIAAGTVLAGAPVFGFIFFRRGPVLTALLAALLVEGAISWGSTQGYWSYAPLVRALTDSQGHLATVWMVSMYGFALPHVLMLGAISYYLLQRGRQREADMRHLSLTDALTGLPNRRSVMAELNLQLEISRRHGLPLAVMMIDVDHFKRINDGHGHAAGDSVLSMISQRLDDALRQSDVVGRYGGEEFLAVLTGTTLEGACILAERCREALATTPVPLDDRKSLRITASFGVSSTDSVLDATAASLLKYADEALYAAKQRGRNRVETVGLDAYVEAASA